MKVLLAADGSEPALAALGLMEAVGRRSGLTVTALCDRRDVHRTSVLGWTR